MIPPDSRRNSIPFSSFIYFLLLCSPSDKVLFIPEAELYSTSKQSQCLVVLEPCPPTSLLSVCYYIKNKNISPLGGTLGQAHTGRFFTYFYLLTLTAHKLRG